MKLKQKQEEISENNWRSRKKLGEEERLDQVKERILMKNEAKEMKRPLAKERNKNKNYKKMNKINEKLRE